MVANLVSKRYPKIARNLGMSLGKSRFSPPEIQFSSPEIQFFSTAFRLLSTAFCFPQWLSAFLNGFPNFLNGFPLSEKSGKIYLWCQVYERSLSELRISAKIAIFRDKNNRQQKYKRSLFELHTFRSELCNSC